MRAGHAFARGISIVGHPLLVLPLAAMLGALSRGADAAAVRNLGLGLGALSLSVLGYSLWRVRSGRWSHLDASARGERRDLNRLLLIVLAVAAAGCGWLQGPTLLTRALALSAALVGVAMLLAHRFNLSLHAAFTTLAAFLPVWLPAIAALLVLALAVAWSRLVLERHRPVEVVAGVLAGIAAGGVLQIA